MTDAILLQQAYSRNNTGDGLLVDLSHALIREALPHVEEIVTFANDVGSFNDLKDVVQVECTSRHPLERLGGILSNLLRLVGLLIFNVPVRWRIFDARRSGAFMTFGVGGGYLRGRHPVEAIKCLINNTMQLAWAGSSRLPSVYLPQSIGPFRYGLHRYLVRRSLRRLSLVCVRDDKSFAELSLPNVKRVPDLAILEIAKCWEESSNKRLASGAAPGRILVVVRPLLGPREATQRLIVVVRAVLQALGDRAELAVQSRGRGNDDELFYRQNFGDHPYRSVREILKEGQTSLVISTRMHASLEAILTGVPSIHLAYERKGFGAFQDLGISRFVSSAYAVTQEALLESVKKIESSPTEYWNSVSENIEKIRDRRTALISSIRAIAKNAE